MIASNQFFTIFAALKTNKFINQNLLRMKKFRLFILLAFFGLSMNSVNAQFFDGNGDADEPFKIDTPARLAKLAELVNDNDVAYISAHYIMTDNLDLSDYQSGDAWTPIGINKTGNIHCFKGVFDGNGYKITGLKVKKAAYAGLFGKVVEGTIKNLGVEYAEIECTESQTSYSIAGIIVGEAGVGSIITNCWATGSVVTSPAGKISAFAGGIVGKIISYTGYTCEISNCYAHVSIECTSDSYTYAGGIAAHASQYLEISNCYSTGSVIAIGSSFNANAGGIVGTIMTGCKLKNSYSLCEVSCTNTSATGAATVGGIAGGIGTSTTVSNCAALNEAVYGKVNGGALYYGRIAGHNGGTLTDNIAFNRMINPDGTTDWDNSDILNGTPVTAKGISEDGTLGGCCAPPKWQTKDDFLPSFGRVEEIPCYLRYNAATPVIAIQPKSATVDVNDTYTFSIFVDNPHCGTPSYQWFSNTTLSNTGGTIIAGETGANYSPNTDTEGIFYYYVEVTNTMTGNGNGGNLSAMIPSNAVKIAVGVDGVETLKNDRITVFPNPTNGQLTIDNGQLTISNVEIFDVMGRKIPLQFIEGVDGAAGRGSYRSYDLTLFPAGIYFLKITTEAGVVTKKVVKQ